MKQADLRVGDDYAFPTYEPYDSAPMAARVRVVSVDGGGKVTVRVMDPGTKLPKNAWGLDRSSGTNNGRSLHVR